MQTKRIHNTVFAEEVQWTSYCLKMSAPAFMEAESQRSLQPLLEADPRRLGENDPGSTISKIGLKTEQYPPAQPALQTAGHGSCALGTGSGGQTMEDRSVRNK